MLNLMAKGANALSSRSWVSDHSRWNQKTVPGWVMPDRGSSRLIKFARTHLINPSRVPVGCHIMRHGSDKRSVEHIKTLDSGESTPRRWSWRVLARKPGCSQWDFVGASHRSSLERSPGTVPAIPDLPRRFQQDAMKDILQALEKDLKERGKLNLSEAVIEGFFSGAKKGGLALGRLNAEKAVKSGQLQTAMVFFSPLTSQVLRPTK